MANFDNFKGKALETIGTIIDKSTEIYNAAEEKAKKLAKIAKLKSEIARYYSEVRKLYSDLGSLYYTLHNEAPEEPMSQLCEEIKIVLDKIAVNQTELDSLDSQPESVVTDADFKEDEPVAEPVQEEPAQEEPVQEECAKEDIPEEAEADIPPEC